MRYARIICFKCKTNIYRLRRFLGPSEIIKPDTLEPVHPETPDPVSGQKMICPRCGDTRQQEMMFNQIPVVNMIADLEELKGVDVRELVLDDNNKLILVIISMPDGGKAAIDINTVAVTLRPE